MEKNPNKIEKESNDEEKFENAIREIVEFIIIMEKGEKSFEKPPSQYAFQKAEGFFGDIYNYIKNIINSIKKRRDIEIDNNMKELSNYIDHIESNKDPGDKIKEQFIQNFREKQNYLKIIIQAYKENPEEVSQRMQKEFPEV